MRNRPSGMRLEAQLIDPMDWDTPEAGYPELDLVQIWLHSTEGLPSPVFLITETGGVLKLDGLGGAHILTSSRDMELPISPDDGGKLPLCPRRVNTRGAVFRQKEVLGTDIPCF